MTVPRSRPYVWVTWLPELLVTYNTCEWAAWFMAHYTGFARADDEPYKAQQAHAALLEQTREEFEARGYSVTSEDVNRFVLTGRTGIKLSGIPDLIAISERPVIVEVKSGKRRPSHRMQLLTYMHAVPRAQNLNYDDMRFDGLLTYPDGAEFVSADELDDFRVKLHSLLKRVVSNQPAAKVPSRRNCRFCKLTTADCKEKVMKDTDFDEGYVGMEGFRVLDKG